MLLARCWVGLCKTILQKLAEKVLPESQYGFRNRHNCTDMVFMVRQLAEKVIEHNTVQYFIFVDLRKSYDFVPREALWLALLKLGVMPYVRTSH